MKRRKDLFQENYAHNSKVDGDSTVTTKDRIVNDQNGTTGQSFRYGNYPASHNGCEAIAVHNSLVLLGKNSTLSDVMHKCQQCGAMIGRGFLGSNPYGLGKVLSSYGVAWEKVKLSQLHRKGVYILSYWNRGMPFHGLHTVAVSYDGTVYTTYNLGSKPTQIQPSAYAKRFICGYYLES